MEFTLLAQRCAPSTSVDVLHAVALTESHFDPLALHDNTNHVSWIASAPSAAAGLAKQWIAGGHSVDIGIMQINSSNLMGLGLTVETALNACHSLAAASQILWAAYARGSTDAERQAALLIALSRYNTGRPLSGIVNGYAGQVLAANGTGAAGISLPLARTAPPPRWDIWAAAAQASRTGSRWLIDNTDHTDEIQGAGAQHVEVFSQEKTPAQPSIDGEPYALFAYRETHAHQP